MNLSSDLPLDYIDRADAVTSTAVYTNFFINHMDVILFADSINRTDIGTCSTVNTTFINPVSSQGHSPFDRFDFVGSLYLNYVTVQAEVNLICFAQVLIFKSKFSCVRNHSSRGVTFTINPTASSVGFEINRNAQFLLTLTFKKTNLKI
jgi:hypothetical protein